MLVNWLNPKVQPRRAGEKGLGCYAITPIAAGETVAAFGGWVCERAELDSLSRDRRARSIQIDDHLFLVGPPDAEPGDWINHSCDPTAGILGNVLIVARRDIDPGEELTFDYAMCDTADYDEFECACESPLCRGKVTAQDWMLAELQRRYDGWFSSYVARRIAGLARQPV